MERVKVGSAEHLFFWIFEAAEKWWVGTFSNDRKAPSCRCYFSNL